MKNKNGWRKVTSSMLAFFLAVMLFGVYVIIGLNLGMFRNETIEKAIQASKYYNESYERFQKEVATLLSETDIPLDVIYNAASLKHFYIDARSYTQKVLAGSGVQGAIEKQVGVSKEEILDAIRNYYEGKSILISDDEQTQLDEVSTTVVELYKGQMDFDFAGKIVEYRGLFVKVSALIVVAAIVLGGIVILALSKMYKKMHEALVYVAISVISASAMLLVFIIMLYYRVDYGTILKEPAYYNKFIDLYVSEIVKALLYPAVLGFLVWNVFLVVIKELRAKALRQSW